MQNCGGSPRATLKIALLYSLWLFAKQKNQTIPVFSKGLIWCQWFSLQFQRRYDILLLVRY